MGGTGIMGLQPVQVPRAPHSERHCAPFNALLSQSWNSWFFPMKLSPVEHRSMCQGLGASAHTQYWPPRPRTSRGICWCKVQNVRILDTCSQVPLCPRPHVVSPKSLPYKLTAFCPEWCLDCIGGEGRKSGPISAVTLCSQWGLGTGMHTMGNFRAGCGSGHLVPRLALPRHVQAA